MTERNRHLGGAPLLPPAIAYVVLAVAAVVAPSAVAGLSPYSGDAELIAFYADHTGAAHLLAFLLLAASVPFAVFSAIVAHRVAEAGLDVPGRLIALVGGTIGAGMLAVSGMITLALTQPGVRDSEAMIRAFQALSFACGGPAFVVFSGLLLAGTSVPALLGRLLPRWVAWFGLGLAVVCEVASLAAATDDLDVLLPVGRFGTLVWFVAVALTWSRGGAEAAR